VRVLGGSGIYTTRPLRRQVALVVGDSIDDGCVLIANGVIQPRVCYTRTLKASGFCLTTKAIGGKTLHMGNDGWLAHMAEITALTLTGPADVVILEVGTNDIHTSVSASDHGSDVTSFLTQGRAAWPHAYFVVDSIFDVSGVAQTTYNAARQSAVAGMSDARMTYHHWDDGSGNDLPSYPAGFYPDGLHPNPSGNGQLVYPIGVLPSYVAPYIPRNNFAVSRNRTPARSGGR
jgi:lysophospholipase L1-like esterase